MKKILLFLLVLIALTVLVSCDGLGHVHSYGEWEVIQKPTCTEKGVKERVCECGSKETLPVPALGHTAGEAVAEEEKPASCTEAGGYYSVSYCTVCGERLTPVWTVTPPSGHTAGDPVVEDRKEPTCTEAGGYYSVSYCTVCGERLTPVWTVTPPSGHTAGMPVTENNKEATCTEGGGYDTVIYCTVCHGEVSRVKTVFPATGHTAGEEHIEVVIPASCESGGNSSSVVYCKVCGQEISRTTFVSPPAGHNYVSGVCTVCGKLKPSEGLRFTREEDGTCSVSGIGSCTDSVVVIPEKSPAGEKVTVIDRNAFSYNGFITEVIIPPTVKTIRSMAFNACTALTKVVIPEGVTSIFIYSFRVCPMLKSIEVPASVTKISGSILYHCGSVESLTVAKNNRTYYSKDNCIIDKNGTLITGIRTSVIPDDGSIKEIGKLAFAGCVEEYVFLTGAVSYSWKIGENGLTDIVIPKGVLSIETYAFEECSHLHTVTIGDGVTSIGKNAFARCYSLSTVYIPASVEVINESAFRDCENLTTVYYAGTEEQWKAITLGENNESLASVTVVCNSSY